MIVHRILQLCAAERSAIHPWPWLLRTCPIMSDSNTQELNGAEPFSERAPTQAIETPKKKTKNSKREVSSRHAPMSEQKLSRKAESMIEITTPTSKKSHAIPMTAAAKTSKSRKPVTMILGHQFVLDLEPEPHDELNEAINPSQPSTDRTSPTNQENFLDSIMMPIPMANLDEDVDNLSPHGSSAPEMYSPLRPGNSNHSHAGRMGSESDADLMMIQKLKTRRDRFLRTVSMSPVLPASLRADLDLLQSEDGVDSSEDDDDDEDDDAFEDPRRRLASSAEFVPRTSSSYSNAGTTSSSLESMSSMDAHLRPSRRTRATTESKPKTTTSADATETTKSDKHEGPTLAALRSGNEIIKEGVISKRGRRRNWQRRYLVLDTRRLYIFKPKATHKPPKHVVLLSFAQCKNSQEINKVSRLSIFDIFTPEKKFALGTPSQTESDAWIAAIQQACEGSMLDTLETSATLKRSLSTRRQDSRLNNKDILAIRDLPENNLCVDCSATSPDWAVINLGVFICLQCSGVHRSLGVQISKVRSVTLDRWEKSHIATMRQIGNATGNSIWEHHIPPYRKKPPPQASTEERRYWIVSKYVKRAFFDFSKINEYPIVPQTLPPPYADDMEALKPALLELLQSDKAFRSHVRSLLLSDS